MALVRIAALVAVAALGLTGCAPKGPSPYSFAVQIDMTPAAVDKVKASKSGLYVTAFYYGLAKPEFISEADQVGRIRLGYEDPAFAGDARRVRMQAQDIDEKLFPKIVKGEVLALVNVSALSAQGSPTDLLYCRSAVVSVLQARTKAPVISCDAGGAP